MHRLRRHGEMVIAGTVFCFLAGLSTSSAATPESAVGKPFSRENASPGQICGVLCVKGAFEALGTDAPSLESLLQKKYVSQRLGSTVADLELAVADHGLCATPVSRLSVDDLSAIEHPVILHVTNMATQFPYSHWVLYLGCEGGAFRIADLPGPTGQFTAADLGAIWDGTGIVVSRRPTNVQTIQLSSLAVSAIPLIGVVALALALVSRFWHFDRLTSTRNTITVTASLLILTAAIVGWRHFLRSDGFLRNARSVRTVSTIFVRPAVNEVKTAANMQTALDRRSLVIDSRQPRDFSAGHLPNAVNLPVYVTPTELRQAMEGVDYSRPIIVYCQSAGCPYSELIASRLIAEGFETIAVYSGGWRDWQEYHRNAG